MARESRKVGDESRRPCLVVAEPGRRVYIILLLLKTWIWISIFHNKTFSRVVQETPNCVLYKKDFEGFQAEPEENEQPPHTLQPSLRPAEVQERGCLWGEGFLL